ncbi:MAG: signal peptidase I [Chloroflexi bacterium]|nr:signal peptidase I [Chloroflexota bacterium]MQC17002.1 signal peptidase I [Chloroflexota bacterium]
MRPRRVTPRLPRPPRILGVAAATVAGIAVTIALTARMVGSRYLRVAVAGESMTPTLLPDDFLVLRAGAPRADRAAGQIVAVRDPRPGTPDRVLLKRIVGLPGESLRVGGGLQINGRVLDEPYAHGATPMEQHRGINRLDTDEYFLMGDHRGASTDSRDFGPVRAEAIIGTAVLRYWPPERFMRIRPPVRRLLGVADGPEPDRPERGRPASGAQPLPWFGAAADEGADSGGETD